MIGKYARFKHPGLVENFDHPIRMVDKRMWGKLTINFFVGSAQGLAYASRLNGVESAFRRVPVHCAHILQWPGFDS